MFCLSSLPEPETEYQINIPYHSKLFCFFAQKSDSIKNSLRLDNKFHIMPIFIGNNILLYGRKNSYFPYHCLIGNDWPLNFLSFGLIIACTLECEYYTIREYPIVFSIIAYFLLGFNLA